MDPSLALAPLRAQAAWVVFGLTHVVLGFGALAPLRIDRTGASPGIGTLVLMLAPGRAISRRARSPASEATPRRPRS